MINVVNIDNFINIDDINIQKNRNYKRNNILLFNPEETTYTSNISKTINVTWNGEFIGEIDNCFTFVPRKIVEKVIYINNEYAILEKFSCEGFCIEQFKEFINIERRKYNIVFYKKKPYFIFYLNLSENTISLTKIKKKDISNIHRRQIFLMYLLGISYKLIIDEDNIYTRKYGKVDYIKNTFKNTTFNKLFTNRTLLDETKEYFESSIDNIYDFIDMIEKKYNDIYSIVNLNIWFNELKSKFHSI